MWSTGRKSGLLAPLRIALLVLSLTRCALAADPLQLTSFPASVSIGKTYTLTWQGGDGSVSGIMSCSRGMLISLII